MNTAKISPAFASVLVSARNLPDSDGVKVKSLVFQLVKESFGIPENHRIKVEVDDRESPNYLVLVRKRDGSVYVSDGIGWVNRADVTGEIEEE